LHIFIISIGSNPFQFWVKLSSFVRNTHYDVIGLEPNRTYNFRVRAENQYGISDPLQADEPITAKFPFTVPDPPGQPRVIDWDTSNATVVWTKPLSDGGSRIQVLSILQSLLSDIIHIRILFRRFLFSIFPLNLNMC